MPVCSPLPLKTFTGFGHLSCPRCKSQLGAVAAWKRDARIWTDEEREADTWRVSSCHTSLTRCGRVMDVSDEQKLPSILQNKLQNRHVCSVESMDRCGLAVRPSPLRHRSIGGVLCSELGGSRFHPVTCCRRDFGGGCGRADLSVRQTTTERVLGWIT